MSFVVRGISALVVLILVMHDALGPGAGRAEPFAPRARPEPG